MKVCLDVQYSAEVACAAAVVFENWEDALPSATYSTNLPVREEYEPGQFYRRELAPLRAVLSLVSETIDTVIVDGYCFLSVDGTPGLGAYLHQELGGKIPVIGVAKNPWRGSNHAFQLLRGQSARPLYITSTGLPLSEAALLIASMAGAFRIPTLLKAVDQLARLKLDETNALI